MTSRSKEDTRMAMDVKLSPMEGKTTGRTKALASSHCSLTRGVCSVCGVHTSYAVVEMEKEEEEEEEEEGRGADGINARMERSDDDDDDDDDEDDGGDKDDRKRSSSSFDHQAVGVCEHHRRTVPILARKGGPEGVG